MFNVDSILSSAGKCVSVVLLCSYCSVISIYKLLTLEGGDATIFVLTVQ